MTSVTSNEIVLVRLLSALEKYWLIDWLIDCYMQHINKSIFTDCSEHVYARWGLTTSRRSYQMCSIKKTILKNFLIFTGKHLRWSLFNKKRLQHRCFPVNIKKFFRTAFLKNICERLLLNSFLKVNEPRISHL